MNDVKTITHSRAASALNEAGALVRRGENADVIIMRTFAHKYIQLSESQRQSIIDYLDRIENQDNPSS